MKVLILLALLGIGDAVVQDKVYPSLDQTPLCGKTPIEPNIAEDRDLELIVGGTVAKPYSWPWQAELCLKINGKCQFHCGASVIASEWIMTAAHCVDDFKDLPGMFGIKVGTYNYHDNEEPEEHFLNVAEVYQHPNYSIPVSTSHDIALLKLSKEITFGSHVQPVCIPKSVENLVHKGKSAWVTGWGAIYENGPVSSQLRQVYVPFLDLRDCEAEYPGQIDPKTMECAGRKGVDSCQGDSGGPLVTKHKDGRWFQAGIVSWGFGCAEEGKAGVYSKPSAMCDFIEKTLGKQICM
ncbi:hypothetical protein L596_030357 [Steinernema carpocapsae]|uniref:Peptidase S1 domain-containing protein n=1 Tax=Steinernema carpocapsae TaxID=34508 RepID=A0A4U5LP51_STECR|nr:hypothetical protein L596_030357 [Steinernema carpocapsae]